MQSLSGTVFVLLWLLFVAAFIVLMRLSCYVEVCRQAEEDEPEDEAVDEPIMPNFDHYLVSVDSAPILTLDQEVQAMKTDGKCHYMNSDVTGEHFPDQQTSVSGKIKIFLIPLKNEEVKEIGLYEYLSKFGLRHGVIRELNGVRKVYPEIHRKTVLIAFGSVWEQADERRLVSYVEFDGAMYGMYLGKEQDVLANKSDDDCYAIAVKKEQ